MTWQFAWRRSWTEVWDPANLSLWRGAIAGADVHATPFMHPDVVRAWVATTGGEAAYAPFFLHARHEDGQEVLWLLVRPRADWRTGFRRWLIPAGAELFDYHDPIATPAHGAGAVLAPGFWPALERDLRRREGSWFDVCALSQIRPECGSGPAFPTPAGSAPRVRLDAYADFDAYIASRRRTIADVRKKWQRLEAERGLRFHPFGASETVGVVAWLPAFEAARAVRYPDSALPPGYLRALAEACVGQGLVRASTLVLGDRVISWDFSFYLNDVFYNYQGTFDEEFYSLSPGRLHNYKLFEWLFQQRARVFDCLLGIETYKNDWTDGEVVMPHSGAIESKAMATALRRFAHRGLRRLNRPAAARAA